MLNPLDQLPGVRRVLYHHRTQGKAVEGVHIRGIADALRCDGVVVDILSLPGADPYATPAALSPTRQATSFMRVIAALPEPVFELAEIGYNLLVAGRLLRHLRQHPDTGLVYERYSLFMVAGVWVARRRRVPLILEINDATFVTRVRPLFFRGLARRLERWMFRNADGLVFVSSVFRERAAAAHGQIAPAIVTPNAANIEQFSATPEQRDAARARLGLEGSIVCGYLGAFVPWHSIDRFVYQLAPYLQEAPDLKLLLIGDGATFAAVQAFVRAQRLEHRVLLAGRVAHQEVPDLLAAMDLAILPNAGDYTSPVKLFEFMAAGIAPVAPDLAPIREVLQPGATGWLFPAGNLQAAVATIIERSRDIAALQQVGRAARDYVASHRQWRNNVRQLLDFRIDVMRRRDVPV